MLVTHVRNTIVHYAMLDDSAPVLIAVSGGPDSVCLLCVLHELGYPLEIVHLDHQTRQGASTADAAFVREMAGNLHLPFHIESRPVAQQALDAKRSFEEYAREVRYDFFKRIARARNCTTLATGHQADDQAETVLMRLLRGTSPRGLAGIPPVTDQLWCRHPCLQRRSQNSDEEQAGMPAPQDLLQRLRIVRPLIAITRAEILAFLSERQIPYRTDASNADARHARNRVRHHLLPLLESEYNSGIRNHLRQLAEMQRDDGQLLETLANEAFTRCVHNTQIDRTQFRELPRPLQRRVIARAAWPHNIDADFERINAAAQFVAEGPTGNAFDFGAGIQLVNGRDTTEIVSEKPTPDLSEIPLTIPGTTRAFGKILTANFISMPAMPLAQYCSPTRQVFDADALGANIHVRHPNTGDRFRPLGLAGSKTLGDYFTDIGLPVPQREAQLLLVDDTEDRERILWVIGHMPSADAAVTDKTRRILEVTVLDET